MQEQYRAPPGGIQIIQRGCFKKRIYFPFIIICFAICASMLLRVHACKEPQTVYHPIAGTASSFDCIQGLLSKWTTGGVAIGRVMVLKSSEEKNSSMQTHKPTQITLASGIKRLYFLQVLMVCSVGTGKMTALKRLLNAGSASKTLTEETGCLKLAAQHLIRELRQADEANLLDEEDMHIFGMKPMTDPLDLVCCNACKKPIKASQYAAHAELCKSLNAGADNGLQPEVCAIDKKPPRKERKKLLIKQTKKVSSFREPQKPQVINSHCIAASGSDLDWKIHMFSSAEPKQNVVHLNSTHKTNGSRASPCNMETSEDAAKHLPLKRTADGYSQNPDAKGSCRTAGVLPHIPAPLATKIYYSQRTNHLRTAICHMFFGEANNESNSGFSSFEALQANTVPSHDASPTNIHHEQVQRQQRHCPTSEQILAASSEIYLGKSSGFDTSMTTASPVNMNNTL